MPQLGGPDKNLRRLDPLPSSHEKRLALPFDLLLGLCGQHATALRHFLRVGELSLGGDGQTTAVQLIDDLCDLVECCFINAMSLKQEGQLSQQHEAACRQALQLRAYAAIVCSFVDVWISRDTTKLPLADALMINYQINQCLAATEGFMLSLASIQPVTVSIGKIYG